MGVKDAGLKLKYSFYSTLVFFLVANPVTFKVVQSLLGRYVTVAVGGCPTPVGLVLHTVVFFGLLYLIMSFPPDKQE